MKVLINGQEKSSHYDRGYGVEIIRTRDVVLITSLKETLDRPNRTTWQPLYPKVIVCRTDLPAKVNFGPHQVEVD